MKKFGLIAIGLALLPFQAFADDLSPADCLVLESMIDLPQATNDKNDSVATMNGYANASIRNETLEQRLARKKEEYARESKERQASHADLKRQSAAAEQTDKLIQERLAHLWDVFEQNACGDKIKSINDQMGCLALDLTILELDPIQYGYGKNMNADKAPMRKNPRVNQNETPIEKELRELEEKNDLEDQKLQDAYSAEYAKADARLKREQKRVKDRLDLLKNASKNNCVGKFSDLTEKVK